MWVFRAYRNWGFAVFFRRLWILAKAMVLMADFSQKDFLLKLSIARGAWPALAGRHLPNLPGR